MANKCSHCGRADCPGRHGSRFYSNEDFDVCQAYNRDHPVVLTDMAFLVDKNGPNRDVVAIMPGLAGRVGKLDSCTCYVHVGQHSSADIDIVKGACEDATLDEYAELKEELERRGYIIYVIPMGCISNMKYTDMRRKELGL